jgi:hypothetical protein
MKNTFKALFVTITIGLFGIWPALSYADWNGHNGHDSGHSHDGGHHDEGHGHSFIGINFSLWPDTYYYGAAYYPPGAVLVSPPVYQPVLINGQTYYLNDGTYYMYNGYSYQPVAPPQVADVQQPVTEIQPPPVIEPAASETNAPSPEVAPDSITINIPNAKSGYTAVTLKKSGTGYIGPQGEFYPKFPKVSELKVIYGK